MSEAWYLAQTKPNCLAIAERNLARQGFRTFAPRIQETSRYRGRFVTRLAPLFPGYVLVAFDAGRSAWRTVNSTYGLTKLVSFGGYPAEVPQALVEELAARCDAAGELRPEAALQPGDQVKVTSGPFSDFAATIGSIAPDRRVWLLIDLMGRETRVAVPPEALRPAG